MPGRNHLENGLWQNGLHHFFFWIGSDHKCILFGICLEIEQKKMDGKITDPPHIDSILVLIRIPEP